MTKKKLPPPTDIQVTIDETPLTRVKEKQILGIVIVEQLSFTPHAELTTKKCRSAYNRLTSYPDLSPNVALELYIYIYIYQIQTRIWMHNLRLQNPPKKSYEEIRKYTKKCLITDIKNHDVYTN